MAGTPGPSFAQPFTREDIEAFVRAAAAEHGVDPDFAVSIAEQESNLNAEIGVSPTGDRGIMQLSPGTIKQFGVKNPDDPYENIVAGMRMLGALQKDHGGDLRKMARRYNASPTAKDEVTDWYVEQVFKRFRKRVGLPDSKPGEDTDGRLPVKPVPGHREDPRATAPASMLHDRRDPLRPLPGDLPPWQQKLQTVGMDPSTPEGKIAIATGVGMAGASGGASLLGAGPWTTFFSGIAGAGLGGGAGQAYNEAYGPPQPAGVTSTPQERIQREMLVQAALEFLPSPVVGIAKGVLRASLEEGISVATKRALAAARAGTKQGFDDALNALKTAITNHKAQIGQEAADLAVSNRDARQTAARAGQAGVDTALGGQAAAQQELDRIRDETARTLQLTRRSAVGEVHAIRRAELTPAQQAAEATRLQAQAALRTATRTGEAGVLSAREAAEAARTQARTVSEGALDVARSNYLQLQRTRPVLDIPAGEAVREMAKRGGPIKVVQDAMGKHVREQAEQIGVVDFRPAKAEINRVLRKDVLPAGLTFPKTGPAVTRWSQGGRHGAEGAHLLDPTGNRVLSNDDVMLQQFLRGVEGKQLEALQANPVMGVMSQILNAPDHVPAGTLHDWYSDLAGADPKLFDPGIRTKMEGLRTHLIGELRRALGSGKHEGYEKAAAEYTELMDLFKAADYGKIQKLAKKSPEKIAQMLNVDDPTPAAALMQILRDVPKGRGGSNAGAEQGRAAAKAVQDAFLNRHLFDDGVEGLSDRIATLDARSEFTDALFGDGQSSDILANARDIAKSWQDSLAAKASKEAAADTSGKALVTGAEERLRIAREEAAETGRLTISEADRRVAAGRGKVEEAKDRARVTIHGAEDTGYQARRAAEGRVDTQRERVAEARRRAKAHNTTVAEEARKLEYELDKRRREAARKNAQALQDKRAEKTRSAAQTPEEQAFEDSSLSPQNLHRSKTGFYTTVRRAMTALIGMHAMGPVGAGLVFAEKGATHATEKDILKYVANSRARTRFLINWIAASQKPNFVAGRAVRAGQTLMDRQLERDKARAAERDKNKRQP